jgi:hypothetical protein
MSFFLSDKPSRFLIGLQKRETNDGKKNSVLNIGREFYSCNNSIYDAINRFERWGLITVIRQKRDLKIKFTEDGHKVISSIGVLAQYN